MFKSRIVFASFLILLISFNFPPYIKISNSFAQSITANKSIDKNQFWVSKKDNLNISIALDPAVPIVDKNTKISFEIKKLNNSFSPTFSNFSAKVTMTDSEGRLFKFEKQNIIDNKFFVNYIFPSNGTDRVILQLFKNGIPFTIGSFDISVPLAPAQDNNFFTNLFKGL
ncbi:MAG: hypothetical protein M3Z01_04145 [Thermoproteota archaeon]|nr:hypothetical protein [Thermoproteota archaeon]